jgi:hypothetical protein
MANPRPLPAPWGLTLIGKKTKIFFEKDKQAVPD